jgi:hypothetical protein
VVHQVAQKLTSTALPDGGGRLLAGDVLGGGQLDGAEAGGRVLAAAPGLDVEQPGDDGDDEGDGQDETAEPAGPLARALRPRVELWMAVGVHGQGANSVR